MEIKKINRNRVSDLQNKKSSGECLYNIGDHVSDSRKECRTV